MTIDSSGRPVRRCPTCGSRLADGGRQCSICGSTVPRRLTLSGAALESLLAVLGVVLLVAGLMWLRSNGRQYLTPGDQNTVDLVARLPTDMPTLTPAPTPTFRPPPNTPDPPTATPLPAVVVHVVQSGDTLYGIAAEYGVSGDTILEANTDTLTSPDRLSIGQELRIPVRRSDESPEGEAPAGEAEAEGPAVAEGGDEEGAVAELPPPGSDEAVAVAHVVTHTIQLGETVEGIAEEHDLPVDELRELNPDKLANPEAELQPGDELLVRVVPAEVSPASRVPGSMDLVSGPGGESGIAVLPPEELGQQLVPLPLPLAPADGATRTEQAPLLIWSSSGLLPAGAYYVVALRDAASPDSEPELVWVTSNATAVRVPAEFRPSLGSERTISWSVTVRRRAGRLLGPDVGLVVSPDPQWRSFTWAPGR